MGWLAWGHTVRQWKTEIPDQACPTLKSVFFLMYDKELKWRHGVMGSS